MNSDVWMSVEVLNITLWEKGEENLKELCQKWHTEIIVITDISQQDKITEDSDVKSLVLRAKT